jgi:hypothetical protein
LEVSAQRHAFTVQGQHLLQHRLGARIVVAGAQYFDTRACLFTLQPVQAALQGAAGGLAQGIFILAGRGR